MGTATGIFFYPWCKVLCSSQKDRCNSKCNPYLFQQIYLKDTVKKKKDVVGECSQQEIVVTMSNNTNFKGF